MAVAVVSTAWAALATIAMLGSVPRGFDDVAYYVAWGAAQVCALLAWVLVALVEIYRVLQAK
jgi:hypothetical protein